MEIKKNIFLKNNNGASGILSLENTSTSTVVTLKLFNLDIHKNLALGLRADKTIYKYPISSNPTEIMLPKLVDNLSNVSCLIVDLSNISSPELVMSGSYVDTLPILEYLENERAKLYEYTEEEIAEEIDNNLNREDPVDNDIAVLSNEERSTTISTDNTTKNTDFYSKIESQLTRMFDTHPVEKTLEEILPNSKWIQVNCNDTHGYYALGLIYDNSRPRFICYAVPYDKLDSAPEDIREYAQWLPIDVDKPRDKGYWISYQDAETGETIEVDVVS